MKDLKPLLSYVAVAVLVQGYWCCFVDTYKNEINLNALKKMPGKRHRVFMVRSVGERVLMCYRSVIGAYELDAAAVIIRDCCCVFG